MTRSVYMVKFLAGLDALVRDRMLLPEDAATLRRQILQKPILLP